MIVKLCSAALDGIDGLSIDVEIDLSEGLPNLVIVGMGDTAIRESRERIRSAIRSFGYRFPQKRMVVNLAPASIKKEGALYDLPMALGLLHASKQAELNTYHEYGLFGELSLDGNLRPVKGVLPMVMALRKLGLSKVIVPYSNRKEAAVVKDMEVYAVKTLAEAVRVLSAERTLRPVAYCLEQESERFVRKKYLDFKDVKGQVFVKRALEIAAAGGHNILMVGPPGSGKSMLAKRFPGILPEMTFEESLECTKIQSVVGVLAHEGLVQERPFRSPHHSVSYVGLVGGGKDPRPGEISLAHRGVLFLDELPEFSRSVLEVLRQPLEDDQVTIVRASGSATFPAQLILVAAMNPCPCGFLTDETKSCHCSSSQIQKYRAKISGPLMDRIDLHVDVPAVSFEHMSQEADEEPSNVIRERVHAARKVQRERLGDGEYAVNAHMNDADLRTLCVCSEDAMHFLRTAVEDMGFSARAYGKILKISRTIADMSEEELITSQHVLEAVQYRSLDRAILAYN